jgi:hypothetical protein
MGSRHTDSRYPSKGKGTSRDKGTSGKDTTGTGTMGTSGSTAARSHTTARRDLETAEAGSN